MSTPARRPGDVIRLIPPGPAVTVLHRQPGPPRPRPLFLTAVPAGFPSPADDFIDKSLDLNDHLIDNPSATFYVRVEGESMRDADINSGDILIVDRAKEPRNNSVVIAAVNGELTVKRIRKTRDSLFLVPDNPEFAPLQITEEMSFEVWGVVTYTIHKV